MKKFLFALLVVAISLMFALPAFAEGDHTCDHDATTIVSLHHCLMHAAEAGHISNAGVAKSLMAKVEAAQAAADRGQTDVAINNLQAFVNEVNAQAGKHIDAEHALHLVEHAGKVIAGLGG